MVQIDAEHFKSLKEKYKGVDFENIKKVAEGWCQTYNGMDAEAREIRGFEKGKVSKWVEKIKDNIILIDTDYKEPEKVPEETKGIENNTDITNHGLELTEEEIRERLRENFELIQEVIQEYADIDEKYLPIITSWIIGTYMHDSFESYPYLFLNAMRGSGKTRLLKLIAKLSKRGEVINNISEAVLFRNVKGSTLCIDEFEGIGGKEATTLRELLNSAYKKGAKVKRMKKKKSKEGEDYVVEEFDIYFPISMANIYGMEEVLGDRCLTIILEKSNKPHIVKLIENYDDNETIKRIKYNFSLIQCSLCSVVTKKNIHKSWNNYIRDKYITNITTLTTNTTLTIHTNNRSIHYTHYIDFFNKIDESKINGRNLELSFPLFLINYFLGDDYLIKIIDVLKNIVYEKNNEEKVESRDVIFLRCLSSLKHTGYLKVNTITEIFKTFADEDETEEKWINPKWVGRALRRLRLTVDKRRTSRGIEVLIDLTKAKKQFQQYE